MECILLHFLLTAIHRSQSHVFHNYHLPNPLSILISFPSDPSVALDDGHGDGRRSFDAAYNRIHRCLQQLDMDRHPLRQDFLNWMRKSPTHRQTDHHPKDRMKMLKLLWHQKQTTTKSVKTKRQPISDLVLNLIFWLSKHTMRKQFVI